MCIIFLSYNDNPEPDGYKLIIASNRDEFYKRPTGPAKFWEKNSNIIAGICLYVACLEGNSGNWDEVRKWTSCGKTIKD
jgi:uncharacterized protein with NRDE domain